MLEKYIIVKHWGYQNNPRERLWQIISTKGLHKNEFFIGGDKVTVELKDRINDSQIIGLLEMGVNVIKQ